jgi:hypothetical protein
MLGVRSFGCCVDYLALRQWADGSDREDSCGPSHYIPMFLVSKVCGSKRVIRRA